MANNISIIGRLGRDSEQKHTTNSTVLEFTIGEDVGFGDKKVTNWWKCAVWGKQAEGALVDYLKKGQQVVVFGEVTQREYEKDGSKRISVEVRVSSVQLAGAKQEGQQQQSPRQMEPARQRPVDAFYDSGIPF
jgi:single-strand DNA-binding protein